jgi:XTP/dITP diphosphohydrolase
MPQLDLCVPQAAEPHDTFIENALAKARHASRHTGLPALADDSGVCVDALGGEPGVHSARYAGDAPSDAAGGRESQDLRNNRKLLAVLANVADRRAHYYCVVVLTRHAGDPQPIIAEGEWHGEILREPRGSGGFGYDPLFLDPEFGKTGAQLTPEDKNRISHRGKALALLLARLRTARVMSGGQ